jgi:hypothetical protein
MGARIGDKVSDNGKWVTLTVRVTRDEYNSIVKHIESEQTKHPLYHISIATVIRGLLLAWIKKN